jgi:hypothetical protein
MKEYALALLKIAVSLFPPLASLLAKAIESMGPPSVEDERELVDLVRGILPIDAPIHEALRRLEKRK